MLSPPESTAILTITAVCFTVASNLMIRKFVDLNAERRARNEVNEWTKQLRNAVKNKDKKEEEKLRKKEQTIRTMQAKSSFSRFKVSLITIIPFFVIYGLLLSYLGPSAGAFSPISIPYLTNACPTSHVTTTTTTATGTSASSNSASTSSTTQTVTTSSTTSSSSGTGPPTTTTTTTKTTSTKTTVNPCPPELLSLGVNFYMTTFGWYLISSFAFSGLLMRVFKTQP
jgi:uncharacterized membrane protein (DUF106 family)